jgi:hypothetical protein
MAENGESKSFLGRIGSILTIVASGLFGATGAVIAIFMMPAKDRAEIDLKHLDIALGILQNSASCDVTIRTWAVQILNSHSGTAKMETDGSKNSLIGTGCNTSKPPSALPPSASAVTQMTRNGAVDQIGVLETEGLSALLAKDLGRAADQFAAAYRLWPVYRNTDEIQRLLRARVSAPPGSDAEWRTLYAGIAKCDLFGVDEGVQSQLAVAAGFSSSREMARKVDPQACGK